MRAHRHQALLLVIAVAIIGMTFGVLADAAGLSLAKVAVMSALVFTGASQFAAVGVVAGGGSGFAAVVSAMLLAARNALYGPVVGRVMPDSIGGRLAASHFVIDETTAMSSIQTSDDDARDAFWFTGIWLWILWVAGSIAGALIGSVLAEPETLGLDAAFPASFVALIAPHLRTSPARFAALCGAGLALVAIPFTPAGVPLLVAVLGVIPGAELARRHRSGPGSEVRS